MLSSTTRFLLANFFTASHRVLGRVQIGSSGLIGLMNDPNNSSIEVSQVSLAQLQEPKVIVEKLSEVRLVKKGILAVGLSRETEVGPPMVARAGYVRVERHNVRGVSSMFEFKGHIEWSGRFDLTTLLIEGGDFIPLYDASLQAIPYPDLMMKSAAILVNRRKLDILSGLEEEPGPAA